MRRLFKYGAASPQAPSPEGDRAYASWQELARSLVRFPGQTEALDLAAKRRDQERRPLRGA